MTKKIGVVPTVPTSSADRDEVFFLSYFDAETFRVSQQVPLSVDDLFQTKAGTKVRERLGVLDSGRLPYGCQIANWCATTLLFDDYITKATKAGVPRRTFETRLGIFLHRAVPGLVKRAGAYSGYNGKTENGTIYEFPDLPTCREAFVALLQQPLVWSGPAAWVDEEPTRTDAVR